MTRVGQQPGKPTSPQSLVVGAHVIGDTKRHASSVSPTRHYSRDCLRGYEGSCSSLGELPSPSSLDPAMSSISITHSSTSTSSLPFLLLLRSYSVSDRRTTGHCTADITPTVPTTLTTASKHHHQNPSTMTMDEVKPPGWPSTASISARLRRSTRRVSQTTKLMGGAGVERQHQKSRGPSRHEKGKRHRSCMFAQFYSRVLLQCAAFFHFVFLLYVSLSQLSLIPIFHCPIHFTLMVGRASFHLNSGFTWSVPSTKNSCAITTKP